MRDAESEQAVTAGTVIGVSLNERLHVPIGYLCNNNCTFCMEEDRGGRRRRLSQVPPEEVHSVLAANVFRKEMMFVSGEPTLHPHFLRYVRWARDLGYETVGVISNGRRFAYAPFAEKAAQAGLNYAIISIHGAVARMHNALTRTPGAFEQCLEGLRNLAALKARRRFAVHTSSVINRRNMAADDLDALYRLLAPLVDQVVFNVVQPWGRGEKRFETIMPRYREVAGHFAAFVHRYPPGTLPVYLLDIPYCTTENMDIPERNRGYIERYVHYERQADEVPEAVALDAIAADLAGGAKAKLDHRMEASGLDDGMRALHRDGQDEKTKAKRLECQSCCYFAVCDGVWRNYLRRFGWQEFEPVTPPNPI